MNNNISRLSCSNTIKYRQINIIEFSDDTVIIPQKVILLHVCIFLVFKTWVSPNSNHHIFITFSVQPSPVCIKMLQFRVWTYITIAVKIQLYILKISPSSSAFPCLYKSFLVQSFNIQYILIAGNFRFIYEVSFYIVFFPPQRTLS